MGRALINNFAGQRFGRLTVVGRDASRRDSTYWICVCDCGKQKSVLGGNLKSGDNRSCGCLRRELAAERGTTHGHKRRKATSAEYRTWRNMISRCNSPHNKCYANYGSRGIKVCDAWVADFAIFLRDVGPRPSPKHTLDRYPNNDGNYEPGNVRWATRTQQNRNRRDNIFISFNGATVSLAEAIEARGLAYSVVRSRYLSGWSLNRALGLEPPDHAEFINVKRAPSKRGAAA